MHHDAQLGRGLLKRGAAFACILLVLLFAGMEATHSHPEAKVPGSAARCAVCISVHGNAPVATFHSLSVMFAVEALAQAFLPQGHGFTSEFSFFIRPPPSL